MQKQLDVVILGAGVAGSYLAHLLKDKGVDFVLIDKQNKHHDYKDDSGIVSTEFLSLMKDVNGHATGKNVVRSRIKSMNIASASGNVISISSEKAFALLLNKQLLEENLHIGLQIRLENVWKIDVFHDCAHVWTDKNDYKCKIVVGADGANSFVRHQLGLSCTNNVNGFLLRTKKRVDIIGKDNDDIDVFLNKNYSKSFFAWDVPKNKEFGVIFSKAEKKDTLTNLDNLKDSMGLSELESVTITSAPIPIGFSKSYTERCLLVGDAASQTKPLTGGGIVFSMKCCKHALDVIDDALNDDDYTENALSEYEKLWKNDIGKTMKQQMLFRKIYSGLTNKDIDNIFDIVRDDFEKIDFKDYDNPMELWKSLSSAKKLRLILKGVKGLLKS